MTLRKVIVMVLLASLSCSPVRCALAENSGGSRAMAWPTEGWDVSTPEEQGLSSGALARLVESVGEYQQDSFLVVRHGKIVTEAYYAPFRSSIPHDLRSVTKSIVSTLTGVEVQQGLLDSIDHPIVDLFSDKTIETVDDRKRAVTVKHLLDMTSGIEWTEKAYTPNETIMQMYGSPDRTAFVLNQPMSGLPGDHFQYNGGNPYLLSALINKLSGRNAFDFAKAELFGPLGITEVHWGDVDAQGVTDGESGLFMTTRDLAKIGLLYLHDGEWDGRQIIPRSWVERVEAGAITATDGFHYSDLWWSLPEKGAYMALGRHSQMIMVLPKLDIVVVMTGVLRDDQFFPKHRLVDDITRAVRSDGSLPADSVAQSLLAASTRSAATERPLATGETPDLARTISGQTFRFSDNRLNVKTWVLHLADDHPSWEVTTGTASEPPKAFGGPVGLDGSYRESPPASYGINVARGRWLDGQTFELNRRILGFGAVQTWQFTFSGDTVNVAFENTDGMKVALHGAIER